jgi:hypothetical protein
MDTVDEDSVLVVLGPTPRDPCSEGLATLGIVRFEARHASDLGGPAMASRKHLIVPPDSRGQAGQWNHGESAYAVAGD